MNIQDSENQELTLTHLLLEGFEGRYEVEALSVTETGIVPVELMETEQAPQLWSLTGEVHDQPATYGDCLREVVQRWCKLQVEKGMALLQQSRLLPYRIQPAHHSLWACEITQANAGVVARFKCAVEASQWLSLMTATTPQVRDDCINNYLNTPLPYANHHNRWWMPLLLRRQPFKPTLIHHRRRVALDLHGHPFPPEQWWGISNNGKTQHLIAEFRLPPMVLAFSAAQLYRLTTTYRDLTPGTAVKIKGGQSQATVVETPPLNQLTPSSMIKVGFKANDVTEVQAQALTWVEENKSEATRKGSRISCNYSNTVITARMPH